MAVRQQTICDRCGAEKRETNNWWQIYISVNLKQLVVVPMGGAREVVVDGMAINAYRGDYCSQACAMRCIDEWMSAQVAESKAVEKGTITDVAG